MLLKPKPTPSGQPGGSCSPARAGFTLIEMVGVLTVVMILACVIFSATVKQVSLNAGRQESANLASHAAALQNGILRNRYIPGPAGWAQVIAAELGADIGTVSSNAARKPRVFVIDSRFQIGTNGSGLPYSQTTTGSVVTTNASVIPPANPRLMMLSSLGPPLPAAITNGVMVATNFDAVWNTADGSAPPSWAIADWGGSPSDFKIQRINLSGQFVRLLLYNYGSADAGRYAIDRLTTNSVPGGGVIAYFIRGSTLQLLTGSGALDSEQILNRDDGFVYDQGVWRGSSSQGPTNTLADTYTGAVTAETLSVFANSPGNPNASGGATPVAVVTAVSNYMSAYTAYAAAGFPSSGTVHDAAKNAETQMQQVMDNLANNFVQGQCQ